MGGMGGGKASGWLHPRPLIGVIPWVGKWRRKSTSSSAELVLKVLMTVRAISVRDEEGSRNGGEEEYRRTLGAAVVVVVVVECVASVPPR